MAEPTDCSALQAALEDLNKFLGQTYITVCQEVARAEYVVQADMRVIRDHETQLASKQPETPGEFATTVTSELPTAAPAVPQHDKLQAVLAQARAIRRQGKTQTASKSHLSSIQPAMTTPPAPRSVTHSTQLNTSSSSHDRSTKCHTVTENRGASDSSRHGHSARPASKSLLPDAQRSREQSPGMLLPVKPSTSGEGTERKPSFIAQPGTDKNASRRNHVPLQLPADFREALNALRQPGLQHPTQSAPASSSRTATASSQAPFVNLGDTYKECMASISEAGAAFKQTLCADDPQAATGIEVLQSWADPDSHSWLRHSALVEAQLLLMQRLSTHLQAHPGGQTGISSASEEEQWQEILQLWQEVQQEYQALFETPAGDPDAVLRWRNRAMRFVLSSETDSTCGEPAGSDKQPSSPGSRLDKPAEAWLPSECWACLDQLPDIGASPNRFAEEPHNVLLPPHVKEGGALVYTDPAQIQTISRLQHQLQLYLLQHHIESKLAVSFLPLERSLSAAGASSPPSQQVLAQIRLAHAFLCKGAEKGLCTITQEQMQ